MLPRAVDDYDECWICKALLTAGSISKTHILFISDSVEKMSFDFPVGSSAARVIMVSSMCSFRVIHQCSILDGCLLWGTMGAL